MRSLRDLQREFADGVLLDAADPICTAIAAHGIAPARRLNIYRNNVREGFLKTLAATFPVIERLAGRDWFRQTGLAYLRTHPSTSGNLHYVGQRFAAFIDAQLAGSAYGYFADVARVEWAYQEVLVAADHPALDIDALRHVDPERFGALRFETHPALRLVASAYPVLAIWQANKTNSTNDLAIDLNAGPSRLLIVRREDHVELRELPPAEFALLDAFTRGCTLDAAVQYALDTHAEFDLGTALARCLQLGAIVDFASAHSE